MKDPLTCLACLQPLAPTKVDDKHNFRTVATLLRLSIHSPNTSQWKFMWVMFIWTYLKNVYMNCNRKYVSGIPLCRDAIQETTWMMQSMDLGNLPGQTWTHEDSVWYGFHGTLTFTGWSCHTTCLFNKKVGHLRRPSVIRSFMCSICFCLDENSDMLGRYSTYFTLDFGFVADWRTSYFSCHESCFGRTWRSWSWRALHSCVFQLYMGVS